MGRARMDKAREELELEPIIYGGKSLCLETKGFLHRWDGRSIPIGCGRWNCNDCGPRKRYNLTRGIIDAWIRKYPDILPTMFTFTLRTKRAWETWEAYRRRNEIEGVDPPREISPGEEFRLIQNQPLPMRPLFRSALSPQGWSRYFRDCFQRIRHRWNMEMDDSIPYFAVIEYTKQGVGHMHMITPLTREHEGWFTKAWLRIHPDCTEERGVYVTDKETYGNKGEIFSTVEMALWYATKYCTKDWQVKGQRRYRKSKHFSLPIYGDEYKFKYGFDYHAYKKLYGRVHRGWMKAIHEYGAEVHRPLKQMDYIEKQKLSDIAGDRDTFDKWLWMKLELDEYVNRWRYRKRKNSKDKTLNYPPPAELFRQWEDGTVEQAKPQSDIWPR